MPTPKHIIYFHFILYGLFFLFLYFLMFSKVIHYFKESKVIQETFSIYLIHGQNYIQQSTFQFKFPLKLLHRDLNKYKNKNFLTSIFFQILRCSLFLFLVCYAIVVATATVVIFLTSISLFFFIMEATLPPFLHLIPTLEVLKMVSNSFKPILPVTDSRT